MANMLELYDARVSRVHLVGATAEIHFSFALIHNTVGTPGRDTGKNWTQEAILLLEDAEIIGEMPPLPNTVIDGYLQDNTTRHELIPLPYAREDAASLHLVFTDDSILDIRGINPQIKLVGSKVFLDDYF